MNYYSSHNILGITEEDDFICGEIIGRFKEGYTVNSTSSIFNTKHYIFVLFYL